MKWFGGCRGIEWRCFGRWTVTPWVGVEGWGWRLGGRVLYGTSFLGVSVQKPCLSSLSLSCSQWFPSCRYRTCNLTKTASYTRPSWHCVQCFSYRALSDNRLKGTPSWRLIGWSRTSPRFPSPHFYCHICIVPAAVIGLSYMTRVRVS